MWLPSPTPENARLVSGAQAAAVPPAPRCWGVCVQSAGQRQGVLEPPCTQRASAPRAAAFPSACSGLGRAPRCRPAVLCGPRGACQSPSVGGSGLLLPVGSTVT